MISHQRPTVSPFLTKLRRLLAVVFLGGLWLGNSAAAGHHLQAEHHRGNAPSSEHREHHQGSHCSSDCQRCAGEYALPSGLLGIATLRASLLLFQERLRFFASLIPGCLFKPPRAIPIVFWSQSYFKNFTTRWSFR